MGQRKSGHVTLLDIARASGFSISTVSIVLSEAPLSQNVAAFTRTHIRTIARQLGYHPDAYARSLRRRTTQTIGIVAFDLSDPFCIPIVRGIQAKLQPSGYFPLLMDVQTQRALFDDYLHMLLERRADGVIVIASWVFEEMNLLGDVRKNNVPILIIGRDLSARGTSSILVDNQEGGLWPCGISANSAIAGSPLSAGLRSCAIRSRAGRGSATWPCNAACNWMNGWFFSFSASRGRHRDLKADCNMSAPCSPGANHSLRSWHSTI